MLYLPLYAQALTFLRIPVSLLLVPGLYGCTMTIPREYPQPEEVTLDQAMRDVVCSLATLQNEQAKLDVNTGTIIDEIEVTLNVTASAKKGSQLVVDATPALPAAVGTLGIGYTGTTELAGSRGNTVRIKLTGFGTAKLNDVGKKAAQKRGFSYGLEASYLAAREDPCNRLIFSREDKERLYRQE